MAVPRTRAVSRLIVLACVASSALFMIDLLDNAVRGVHRAPSAGCLIEVIHTRNLRVLQSKDEINFRFTAMLPPVEYRSVVRFLLLRHYDKQAIQSELATAYGDD